MNDSHKEIEVRDDQGKLTGRFQLVDGKLHGKAILFSGGRVIAEIGYLHGQRQGEMRSFGDDGQLSSVIQHSEGLPHGEASYFYPDGSLARHANYKEGRLHGEVRDYAPDGKELACDSYIDGKKQAAPSRVTTAAATSSEGEQRRSWFARLVEG